MRGQSRASVMVFKARAELRAAWTGEGAVPPLT
jgi:hypothetical protein